MKQLSPFHFILGVFTLLFSCGPSKELVSVAEQKPREMIELPIDYGYIFPTPSFENWDNDYNSFEQYLTKKIIRTQMGLSTNHNGVQIWWCMPSARTHVQLDTTMMIHDEVKLIGNWRIISNRIITYEDSAVYADNKIYRSSTILKDNKEDDLLLSFTSSKMNLFVKENGKSKFRKLASKNYDIESKRYLMLYGTSLASAAVWFIGQDSDGKLMLNIFYVQERKVKGVYIVYQATVTQFVFDKIAP